MDKLTIANMTTASALIYLPLGILELVHRVRDELSRIKARAESHKR